MNQESGAAPGLTRPADRASDGGSSGLLTDYRLQQRDYLLRIARAMTARLDLQDLLEIVLRSAVTMTNGQAGAIAMRRPDGTHGIVASFHLDERLSVQLESVLDEVTAGGVHPSDAAAREPEPDADDPGTGLARWLPDSPPGEGRHLLTLPLAMSGEPIGRILILRSEGAAVFTPLDSRLLGAFADQAAVAIQNAYLHEQLRARERQLAAIVEHNPGGILLADADGTIVAHNPSASALAGQDRGHLQGRRLAEAVPLVDERGRELAVSLPDGDATEVATRGFVRLPGGGRGAYVQVAVTVLRTEDGVPYAYVADVADLTAYKEAEDTKTAFLAGLSHELKTPLALIRGYAETLRLDEARSDPGLFDEAVAVILEESAHLTVTVERLLQAARMQSGAVTLDLDVLDVTALAERLVAEFRTAHPDREWRLRVEENVPLITADRMRLREALQNLLANAVKYADPGAPVDVSVEPWHEGVRVAVRDRGIGIAPADAERVFERFVRVSDRADGTGLGLFMARAIVEAHGGTINLDSAPGAGSTFAIELPETANAPQTATEVGYRGGD